jgi:hypothetical protein
MRWVSVLSVLVVATAAVTIANGTASQKLAAAECPLMELPISGEYIISAATEQKALWRDTMVFQEMNQLTGNHSTSNHTKGAQPSLLLLHHLDLQNASVNHS